VNQKNEMACSRRDWVSGIGSFIVAWGLPLSSVVVTSVFFEQAISRVWPIAFAWMGTACLINAGRCGRTHCYFTGAFFVVIAILSFLYALNLIHLGERGWGTIGATALLGGISI